MSDLIQTYRDAGELMRAYKPFTFRTLRPVPGSPAASGAAPWTGGTRASLTGNVVGTDALGGFAAAGTTAVFADNVANASALSELGMMIRQTNVNLQVCRLTVGVPATAAGENPSSPVTPTAAEMTMTVIRPTEYSVHDIFTKQFIEQTEGGAAMVLQHMIAQLYLKVEADQYTTLLNDAAVGTVAIATNGGSYAATTHALMEKTIRGGGVRNPLALAATPATVQGMRVRPAVGTDGIPLAFGALCLGDRLVTTAGLPTNLTKGSATTICHGAILGDWSSYLLAEFGPGVDVVMNPMSYARQGGIGVHVFGHYGGAVVKPSAFAKCVDILAP